MKIKPLIFFCFLCFGAYSQNQNSIWCFGDSAGIDFSSGSAVGFSSGMDGRGSCTSIADSSGNLLFYAFTRANTAGKTGRIFDSSHQLMQNGDSIIGEAWYNEMSIAPIDSGIYYLFSMGETWPGQKGFYYSIIDMNQNGGLGLVIQKNIQLNSFRNADCVSLIKHGNGKDWWAISKYSTGSNNTVFNRFCVYHVSASGISPPLSQDLLNAHDMDQEKIIINSDGTKIMQINVFGLMAEYDFDRCTGILSNQNVILQEQTVVSHPYFWDGCYSSDDSKFYVSSQPIDAAVNDTNFLIQYDLSSSNIPSSAETLYFFHFPVVAGALRLAPNNKIYFSSNYQYGFPGYPYPNTVYNQYIMNLSVINQPDSQGVACDFQPFSFNLGGKRTYYGLPNNPNYSLGPLAGSPCDTLGVGINEHEIKIGPELNVFYHPSWQKLFVNAQHIKGRNCLLQINDMNGKLLFSSSKQTQPPYFTQEIDCSTLSSGVYVVSLQTEKEQLVKKFVKE
jgi:hypothetical protein